MKADPVETPSKPGPAKIDKANVCTAKKKVFGEHADLIKKLAK